MRSIQLTEKHKSKLLEMCKVLFPEYEGGLHLDVPKGLNTNHIFIIGFIDESNDYIDNCDLYIHWFEFCMIHLVDKIYYPKPKPRGGTIEKIKRFFFQTFIDSMEGATSGYDHPIDYLYKEFKKLK